MRSLFLFLTLPCLVCCSQSSAQDLNSKSLRSSVTGDKHDQQAKPSTIAEALKPHEIVKLDKYFQRYCDYTGGLGIGLVASHTYAYKFRQYLKNTKDNELKRLFVLNHLYGEIDIAIHDYEHGVVRVGKADERQMTSDEKVATRKELLYKLDDLELFDPRDPEREIAVNRGKLR
jgi:hypothetical protein